MHEESETSDMISEGSPDHEVDPMPPVPFNGAAATDPDEIAILTSLFGPPDADGVFHSDEVDE